MTEAMFSLTQTALENARRLQATTVEYQGKSLRLYLDGKGCDGFYYGVTFDTPTADDHQFLQQGFPLIVDHDTLYFTNGAVVDWIDDERGCGFLVDNPNHNKFRGKFYKRKSFAPRFAEHRDQPQS